MNYCLQGIPKKNLEDPRITRNYRMSGPPVSDRSALFSFSIVLFAINLAEQNCVNDFLCIVYTT